MSPYGEFFEDTLLGCDRAQEIRFQRENPPKAFWPQTPCAFGPELGGEKIGTGRARFFSDLAGRRSGRAIRWAGT